MTITVRCASACTAVGMFETFDDAIGKNWTRVREDGKPDRWLCPEHKAAVARLAETGLTRESRILES